MISEGDWPRRGEVWWADTPGQPDDPHQPRPCIIVSVNSRNARTDDVIVVPVFSAGKPGPNRVSLPLGTAGLPHVSIAFCDEVTTLHHQFLDGGPVGSPVPSELLAQLIVAILNSVQP